MRAMTSRTSYWKRGAVEVVVVVAEARMPHMLGARDQIGARLM